MFVALHDATNAGVHRKFTISLAKIYIYCKIKTNLLLYCIIPFYIIFFFVSSARYGRSASFRIQTDTNSRSGNSAEQLTGV